MLHATTLTLPSLEVGRLWKFVDSVQEPGQAPETVRQLEEILTTTSTLRSWSHVCIFLSHASKCAGPKYIATEK